MEVINLQRLYGKKYKVRFEESRQAEYGPKAWRKDPWYMILLCQHGHICPWGGMLLAACTKGRGGIAGRLMGLPFVHQDKSQVGDDGTNAVFHLEYIDEVLDIMKPRLRRQYTDEQRKALADRARRIFSWA